MLAPRLKLLTWVVAAVLAFGVLAVAVMDSLLPGRTSSLHEARKGHTATLLPDGRVAVVGGYNDRDGLLGSVEVWSHGLDLTLSNWSRAAPLHTPRSGHKTFLLGDGRLVVVGGRRRTLTGDEAANSLEISTADLTSWKEIAAPFHLDGVLEGETSVQLGPQTILLFGVAGGKDCFGPPCSRRIAIWNATTGVWTEDEGFPFDGLSRARAVALSNGNVLVARSDKFALWDASSHHWQVLPLPPSFGSIKSLFALRGGQAMLMDTGRDDVSNGTVTLLWDSQVSAWRPGGSMLRERSGEGWTLLADDRVVVTGGGLTDQYERNAFDSVEIFDERERSWSVAQSLRAPRMSHTATLLPDGRILIVGGQWGDSIFAGKFVTLVQDKTLATAELWQLPRTN